VNARLWDTQRPVDPEFASAWDARLAAAPHANFAMDPAYLRWEGAHGRHSLAALVEDSDRRGALVLRREGGGFVCGQPWRWHAIVEGKRCDQPVGLDSEDAAWMIDWAERLAERRPVRCYFPVAPPRGTPGYQAYTTVLYSIAHGDDELLQGMHASKRRMIRRAQRGGYAVVEGGDLDGLRAFDALVRESQARRGHASGPKSEAVPAPGEAWREWEHPWMWLLLALKDGRVVSGLGDGVRPGGMMMDGRKGATAPEARRDGVFALLSYEEARRGRDRGFRWINLGGNTTFKREFAGTLGTSIPLYCWLAGGAMWGVSNHVATAWQRARARAGAWARGLRRNAPGAAEAP
jgi:hypothetical protein